MEQKWQGLAHGLSNVLLKNIVAMHVDSESGVLVSEWTPKEGSGSEIRVEDAAMAMIALADFEKHVTYSPELQQRASELLRREAEFLVSVQADDGAFAEAYEVTTRAPLGEPHTLQAQAFAVRGLLRAYERTGERRFFEAAGSTMRFMNERLWHEGVGIYRSRLGATTTLYTPLNLGAAMGALREWILVAQDSREIERYKQFHVQGLNRSGILLAEESDTGETSVGEGTDLDRDGILWFGGAGRAGRGVAAVHASEVEIATPDLPAARSGALGGQV